MTDESASMDPSLNHKITDSEFDNTIFLFSEYRRREDRVVPLLELWIQRKSSATPSGVKEVFGQFNIETLDELIVRLIEHKINLEKLL